jgi:2-polyprenyl-3-methyl-5-hydroxy-6-metoxy-1,4-benzoquinol methylase
MSTDKLARLEESWVANAAAWTAAVREQRIASRRAGTDDAIVAQCAATPGTRVLDVGCGEGWLARRLHAHGADVIGVDASAPLIAAAREAGGAEFAVVDYATLARDAAVAAGPFDVIVCNFALFDEDLVPLLRGLSSRLAPRARLIIQTIHPITASGSGAYRDGWREEQFAACGDGFEKSMPWYFRTMASWHDVVQRSGLEIARLAEPRNSDDLVLSLILECQRRAM